MIYQVDPIAGLVCVAALLSALWASKSYQVAKEALRVAQRERNAKDGSTEVYLAQINLFRTADKKKFILASILYTNRSEVANSIVRIELVALYTNNESRLNVVAQATTTKPNARVLKGTELSRPPISLPPRDAKSVSLGFELPFTLSEIAIDTYQIEALLADGETVMIESPIAPEIRDEKN